MTTITAVELRKDMGNIFKRAQKGEEFKVSYRRSITATLKVDEPTEQGNGKAILAAARKFHENNREALEELRKEFGNNDAKQIAHEYWDQKYGL